jgi:hypothetical protein
MVNGMMVRIVFAFPLRPARMSCLATNGFLAQAALGALALQGCATAPSHRNMADAQYQVQQQQGPQSGATACPAPATAAGAEQPLSPCPPKAWRAPNAGPRRPADPCHRGRPRHAFEEGAYVVAPNGALAVGGVVEVAAAGRPRARRWRAICGAGWCRPAISAAICPTICAFSSTRRRAWRYRWRGRGVPAGPGFRGRAGRHQFHQHLQPPRERRCQ